MLDPGEEFAGVFFLSFGDHHRDTEAQRREPNAYVLRVSDFSVRIPNRTGRKRAQAKFCSVAGNRSLSAIISRQRAARRLLRCAAHPVIPVSVERGVL
jgi:hypothetical protein